MKFGIGTGDIVRYGNQRDNLPLWLGVVMDNDRCDPLSDCVAVDWFQGDGRKPIGNEGVITNVCRLRLYDGRLL